MTTKTKSQGTHVVYMDDICAMDKLRAEMTAIMRSIYGDIATFDMTSPSPTDWKIIIPVFNTVRTTTVAVPGNATIQ